MEKSFIHINCDLGEGAGNDALIMPLISSCNVACGGHVGERASILETISLAKLNNVQVGAHPSYPDRSNFGREVLNIDSQKLYSSLKVQMQLVIDCAEEMEVSLSHIKPHGALYNEAARNIKIAQIILEAVNDVNGPCEIYAPYKSTIARLAIEKGLKVKYEAFVDRSYNDDLSLVSRINRNAMIPLEHVISHISEMQNYGLVRTIHGNSVSLKADTFCIHGDNPLVVEILELLHQHFSN
ncbi:MAG: LamB/YcsF family protein [Reichenbachiella sp.]